MLKCGCGIMIECEVKIGQTIESIEKTRREGDKTVVTERMNRRVREEWMK